MTVPGSHGCIRMRNDDVIDLFDRVKAGTRVMIEAQAPGRDSTEGWSRGGFGLLTHLK